MLTDSDPVVRMDMHLYAWRCMRALVAAGQASQNPQNLDVQVAMHPARVGMLPRTALWVRSAREVSKQVQQILENRNIAPEKLLAVAPRVSPLVRQNGNSLRARRFPPPPLVPSPGNATV